MHRTINAHKSNKITNNYKKVNLTFITVIIRYVTYLVKEKINYYLAAHSSKMQSPMIAFNSVPSNGLNTYLQSLFKPLFSI